MFACTPRGRGDSGTSGATHQCQRVAEGDQDDVVQGKRPLLLEEGGELRAEAASVEVLLGHHRVVHGAQVVHKVRRRKVRCRDNEARPTRRNAANVFC